MPAIRQVRYVRPKLYPAQEAALFTDARYSVVEASTKAGKTVGCLVWLHEQAALHGGPGRNHWWVAPSTGQARIAFDRLKRFLPAGTFTSNNTDRTVTLANGSVLWFKTGEKPDLLFGEDVHAVVIDEATRVREASWIAIRSTLTATRGHVRIIGNVKGRKNWAYQMARRAESGEAGMHYAKLTAWDAVAGGVLAAEEIEDARRMLPAAAFDELYLAIPGDDGSNPFGRDAIAASVAEMTDGHPRSWGWDLARTTDWTVGIALDADRATCRLRRMQHIPWAAQVRRIREVTGFVPALVDSTGVGDAIIEQLQVARSNFSGFKFTAVSRQQLLEGLAYHVTGGTVSFPREVADELDEFEWVHTLSGVRWAVPDGMHDDRVMALALAVKHHARGRPNLRFLDDDEEPEPVQS